MANKTKSKSIVKSLTIDATKPIVKEYIDKDEELLRYIETMMPHKPNNKIRVVNLRTSKDSKYSWHRVNYYQEFTEGLVVNKKITASRYIQIEYTDDGYMISDQTI